MSATAAIARIADEMEERVRVSRWRNDIALYAWEKHKVWLWERQADACRALVAGRKAAIASANGVGKTLLAAVISAWFHDCFNPGIAIITAPRFDQIKDTTFKELRRLLGRRDGMMPKNPRIETAPDHYINGTTATDATSFQGIHCDSLMLVYEEAVGIHPQFWEAGRSIVQGGENIYWLCIFNPTDSTSHAKVECDSGQWDVIKIAAFEHPNVVAELCGLDAPIPGALRLGPLLENMKEWGDPQGCWHDAPQEGDVDLWDHATYGFAEMSPRCTRKLGHAEDAPRVSAPRVVDAAKEYFPARYWRPGAIGEARICARWPSQGSLAIFPESLLDRTFKPPADEDRPTIDVGIIPSIGCDVARFGDDMSVLHAQSGGIPLEHEQHGGKDTSQVAGALKAMCRRIARRFSVPPWSIPCIVDDTGVGGGVVDQRHGFVTQDDIDAGLTGEPAGTPVVFRFVPVNAQQLAFDEQHYPNARSEMLFALQRFMLDGKAHFGLLAKDVARRLRGQMARIKYNLDKDGRLTAMPKAKVKEETGRSPDDLDAVALSYYGTLALNVPIRPSDVAPGPPRSAADRRPEPPRETHERTPKKERPRDRFARMLGQRPEDDW